MKADKVGLMLRLEPDLHATIKSVAKASGRSLNNEIGERLRLSLQGESMEMVVERMMGYRAANAKPPHWAYGYSDFTPEALRKLANHYLDDVSAAIANPDLHDPGELLTTFRILERLEDAITEKIAEINLSGPFSET